MAFNPNEGRNEYQASASQTIFTFNFKIYKDTDISVYQTPSSQPPNDADDILLLTTDYTVSINGDSGGTVTLVSGAGLNDAITIVRNLSNLRDIEYQESGDFFAGTINSDQNYQTYLIADQDARNNRSVRVPVSSQNISTELPQPDALALIGWNSTETGLENYTIGDNSVVVNIFNINSIADLAGVNTSIYSTVNVRGYYTPNDGGGGIFNYDATQAAVNNGDTVIYGWVRQDLGLSSTALSSNISSKNKFEERLKKASIYSQKVVWIGDSIVEQGKAAVGNGIGFTTFLEQEYPGATYVNEGIGGNTTLDVIARISTITAHSADLYVLAIGVNDIRYNDTRGATNYAAYIANINTIYDAIVLAGGELSIIGIWPTYWEDQFAALLREKTDNRMKQYNNELRNFSRVNNIAFSDPTSSIRRCVNLSNVKTIFPDGVHPDYTGTLGKKMYANAVLSNDINPSDYAANTYINGKVFFKFVFGDNGQSDGLLGIKNILVNGTTFQERFGTSANLPFNDITNMYGSYDAGFVGFFNKANDFPLTTTVSLDAWPDSVVVTGVTKSVGDLNRGPKSFETWFSTDPDSLADISHKSWVLLHKDTRTDANVVNIIPKQRNGFYYRLRVNTIGGGQPSVLLKNIATSYPIRVQTLNLLITSEQRYDLIFGAGATLSTDGLDFSTPSILMWESELEENELTITSFNASLGDFIISHSTDPDALSDPVHPSWQDIITSTGDGTYSIPRTKPIAYLANSAATDVPGIVASYNTLLQRLRDVNLMDLP